MRRMADVRAAEDAVGHAADGDCAAARGELAQERQPALDLGAGGPAIRGRRARVRRDDVPEEDIVLDAELGEDAVDDRRGRLGRAAAGELPLGREGQPGDAGTAVAGSLPDEEDRSGAPLQEVGLEPLPEQP